VHDGVHALDFQPLWLAPWVLAMQLCSVVGITIAGMLLFLVPAMGELFENQLHYPSSLSKLLMQGIGIGAAFWVGMLPAVVPTYLCLTSKINVHERMLRQTESYTLADAKCAVESDRLLVEKQVEQLFRARPRLGLVPNQPTQDAIARFDRFVRTDLKDQIARRIGRPEQISYKLAVLVNLPLLFASLANTLDCDGGACEESAQREGYSSTAQLMLTTLACWIHCILFVYPSTFPMMLCLLQRSGCTDRFKLANGILSIAVAYLYMASMTGFLSGLILNAIFYPGWTWKLIMMPALAISLALNWRLFDLPIMPLVVYLACAGAATWALSLWL